MNECLEWDLQWHPWLEIATVLATSSSPFAGQQGLLITLSSHDPSEAYAFSSLLRSESRRLKRNDRRLLSSSGKTMYRTEEWMNVLSHPYHQTQITETEYRDLKERDIESVLILIIESYLETWAKGEADIKQTLLRTRGRLLFSMLF